MKTLIISKHLQLCATIPAILTQAGFQVELCTSNPTLKYLRHVDRFYIMPDDQVLIEHIQVLLCEDYQLIVITDDFMLKILLDATLHRV